MSESRPANADMVEGYRDGLDLTSPEPSDNRSRSYRHGFINGRVDRSGKPHWANADDAREAADWAMFLDEFEMG